MTLWIARATHRTLPLEAVSPSMEHDDACEWLEELVTKLPYLTEQERDHAASRAHTAEYGMRHTAVAWCFRVYRAADF